MRAFIALLVCFATPAFAQYNGPAVEACRAYAKQEIKREGMRAKDVVFERDQQLSLERYTRKLGSQFVSSILRGGGAVNAGARRARSSPSSACSPTRSGRCSSSGCPGRARRLSRNARATRRCARRRVRASRRCSRSPRTT
jgi:hypothetical protein